MLQDDLAIKYKYKKLPDEISVSVRNEYSNSIPSCLKTTGDSGFKIKTKNGTLISNGYNRIVIGDYGAFIEFDESEVVKDNICIQIGQEYRVTDERYNKNVKYHWLTVKDNSGIKIYFQQKTVSYADYKANMYYVSPSDILLNQLN